MAHFLSLVLITTSGAVVGCCWLGWQLLRQNGRVLLRLEELERRLDQLEFGEPAERAGLPLGSPAPDLELPDLNGKHRTLAEFRGQSLLLIFFNPACGFCRELANRLAAVGIRRQAEGHRPPGTSAASDGNALPLIITSGDREQNRQFFAEHEVECSVLVRAEDGSVDCVWGEWDTKRVSD